MCHVLPTLAFIVSLVWFAQPVRSQWSQGIAVQLQLANGTNYTFFGLESSFGASLGSTVIQGVIVTASPIDACSTLLNNCFPNATLPIILLIERGNCSFESKVYLAQQAGASFVIVFNNRTEQLFSMYGSMGLNVTISSVFLSLQDGQSILDIIATSESVISRVFEDNGEFGLFSFTSQWVFIVFIGILVVLVSSFLILVFLVVEIMRQRNRRRRFGPKPVPPQIVINLPLVEITDSDTKDPDKNMTCAICLEDFMPRMMVRELPCKHLFHELCIDPWLTRHNCLCPVCKQDISATSRAIPRTAPEVSSGEAIEMQLMGSSILPSSSQITIPDFADEEERLSSSFSRYPIQPTRTLPAEPHPYATDSVNQRAQRLFDDDDDDEDEEADLALKDERRTRTSQPPARLDVPVTEEDYDSSYF